MTITKDIFKSIDNHFKNVLSENIWERPSDYAGYNPEGQILLYSKHRDSSILEQSNYHIIEKTPCVYSWRASHWAVGYIDYLMLDLNDDNLTEKVLIDIAEMLCSLESYPVLDDEHYSNLQWDSILDYWERLTIVDRIEYCDKADVSVFAARRDTLEDRLYDILSEEFY